MDEGGNEMKGCCESCMKFRVLSELGLCRECEYEMIGKGMEVYRNDEVVDKGDMVLGFREFKVSVDKKGSEV